jgi:7-carboxy-7-deazaguanine synthase
MAKIKLAELFYSIQGEGRYMGVPSVFLRTFGCNFTCDGFGMARGEKTEERHLIAKEIDKFKTYEELPIVSTGCDSYASWDVRFKKLSPMVETDGIVESIMSMLPHKQWRDEHLVITGGEPLLGWQRAYPDLLSHPDMKDLKEITFETNGTQTLDPKFMDYLFAWLYDRDDREITFSVSPKLPCSGEVFEDAIKPEVVCEFEQVGTAYLKFVVATEQDFEDAQKAISQYKLNGFKGHIYLMPIGGTESVYTLNSRTVADLSIRNGYRYSDRLQVPLFKNEWGT